MLAWLIHARVLNPTLSLTDASKSGMTAENVAAAARAGKQMTRQEAEQILGIESGATWEEISKVGNGEGRCTALFVGFMYGCARMRHYYCPVS